MTGVGLTTTDPATGITLGVALYATLLAAIAAGQLDPDAPGVARQVADARDRATVETANDIAPHGYTAAQAKTLGATLWTGSDGVARSYLGTWALVGLGIHLHRGLAQATVWIADGHLHVHTSDPQLLLDIHVAVYQAATAAA